MPRSLLLHTCCGPCMTQSLNVLTGLDGWEKSLDEKPDFKIAVSFFNPNISPREEYRKRKDEIKKVVSLLKVKNTEVLDNYQNEEEEIVRWLMAVKGLENEPEKGKRCWVCFEYRLQKTFETAVNLGIKCVATTLTLSPMKDSAVINAIGKKLSEQTGIRYIKSDFKKNNGYQKSIQLSKDMGIYRQNYCGCQFSLPKDNSL